MVRARGDFEWKQTSAVILYLRSMLVSDDRLREEDINPYFNRKTEQRKNKIGGEDMRILLESVFGKGKG